MSQAKVGKEPCHGIPERGILCMEDDCTHGCWINRASRTATDFLAWGFDLPKGDRMAGYVDGYVLPIPKKHLQVYRRMAQKAGKIWREHGALDYKECAGDDLKITMGVSFPRQMKVKSGETVVFAYILFKSRAHRDRVNAKVMKDPRLAGMGDPKDMPFDHKRMVYGGFKVLVDA